MSRNRVHMAIFGAPRALGRALGTMGNTTGTPRGLGYKSPAQIRQICLLFEARENVATKALAGASLRCLPRTRAAPHPTTSPSALSCQHEDHRRESGTERESEGRRT